MATGTPNLDAETDDGLRDIIRDVQRSPIRAAEIWWDRDDSTAHGVAIDIAKYASMLLNSRAHRRDGRIERAQTLENALEYRLSQLPQYARW